MFVFGRTGCDDVETLVARIIRVSNDECFSMAAMSSNGSPFGSSLPGSIGVRVRTSARMHPVDHRSMLVSKR